MEIELDKIEQLINKLNDTITKYSNSYGKLEFNSLREAARRGDLETCKILLEHGADVDVQSTGIWSNSTPLHLAAYNGHTEVCNLLLKRGAYINARDEFWQTPLHRAAKNGQTETCKTLIEHGATADAMNKYGKTALQEAANYGHTETCELLKSYSRSY